MTGTPDLRAGSAAAGTKSESLNGWGPKLGTVAPFRGFGEVLGIVCCLILLAPQVGFEPTTLRLTAETEVICRVLPPLAPNC